MAKLSEILGDSYSTLSEEIRKRYENIDLIDNSKYVERPEFDKIKQTRKQLEADIKGRDTQLEDLKKSAGDNAALKQQIESLQSDSKKRDEDYQVELRDSKLTNTIRLAIADSAQDVDLVSSLIDKSKLILTGDGKVTGLDEQVTSLKENKSFLFKVGENNSPDNQIQFTKEITGSDSGTGKQSLSDLVQARNANLSVDISL